MAVAMMTNSETATRTKARVREAVSTVGRMRRLICRPRNASPTMSPILMRITLPYPVVKNWPSPSSRV